MSLNNTTADALGTAIAAALAGLSEAQKANTTLVWQTIARQIYTKLKTDAVITLPLNSVVTVGSAATQTGPTTPVVMNPT